MIRSVRVISLSGTLAAACLIAGAGPAPSSLTTGSTQPTEPSAVTASPNSEAAATPAVRQLLFSPDYDFEVLVDGMPVPNAFCYNSRQIAGMLIVADPIAVPVFARMRDRKVVSLDPAKVHETGDGLAVDPDGFGEVAADWHTEAGMADFTLKGRLYRVQERPILIGQATVQQLLDSHPGYRRRVALYRPDPQPIAFLKRWTGSVDIDVLFGSWCHVCQEQVPRLLRAIGDAANPNLHLSLTGLRRNFAHDGNAIHRNVSTIPTVIVATRGHELGRIVGPPKSSYEAELAALLRPITPAGN